MFQFFNSFRSEKKPDHQRLHRTHNLEESANYSCQTSVKISNKQSHHNTSHSSVPNDKINFFKTDKNSHKLMLKRQFFTVSSEIELDGQKYKLLNICPDGQFIGNLRNASDQAISNECHFAVIQKVAFGCSEHKNGFQSANSHFQEKCMNECGNISKAQQSQIDQDLQCIVFELKFDKAASSPVRVLFKGPFMSLLDFQGLKRQKDEKETSIDQREKIKTLVDSVEKWFDDSECTMELTRDGLRQKQADQNLQNDQNGLKVQQSYRYRFRNHQDFLSIKFLIVDRLKILVKMRLINQQKNLIDQTKNQIVSFKFDQKDTQREQKKEDESKLQREDNCLEEDKEEQPYKKHQKSQILVNELPIKSINQVDGQDQKLPVDQEKNHQQFEQAYHQLPPICPLYALQHQPSKTKMPNQCFIKPQLIPLSQFQSSQMFEHQISENGIHKTQPVQMIDSYKVSEKQQDEAQKQWQKHNALTYENLPGEILIKDKHYQDLTFSNEKTIPEKIDLCQGDTPMANLEINPYTNQDLNPQQQHSKFNFKQHFTNSAMIDQSQEPHGQITQNIRHNSNENIHKNIFSEQTTVNKLQTINPYSSFNVQSNNNPLNQMQQEAQQMRQERQRMIAKKLTFEDSSFKSGLSQPIDQQSENNFSWIENYKIVEQMEKQMGGYKSEDLSQQNQQSFSEQNKSIEVSPQQMPQQINRVQPQIQNLSSDMYQNQSNPLNSQPLNIQQRYKTHNKTQKNLLLETYQSLSRPQIVRLQNQSQQDYQVICNLVKAQKLFKPELPQYNDSGLSQQLQSLENTEYSRSTYSLLRNSQKSIFCLQILKQQGKINKPTTSTQPKPKDDINKLMLYNPLLLQTSKSSHSHPHNKFHNIKSFHSALHKVNKLEVSHDQQHVLLYSTQEHSHRVVLEYSIKEQKFTGMFKIPSLCSSSGLTSKPLPLIKVQYLNNDSVNDFCAMTSKQICLFSKKAHNCNKITTGEHSYHKVFMYRNLFSDKKSNEYLFDDFELHLKGKYLVAGLSGRFIRVFDLEKQQEGQNMSRIHLDAIKKVRNSQNVRNMENIKKLSKQKRNKQLREMKQVSWEETNKNTNNKTKSIKRIKRIKRVMGVNKSTKACQLKEYKRMSKNYDNYRVFYLKSLNSFDLEDQQNISPSLSQQFITQIDNQTDQNKPGPCTKIDKIKLIYQPSSNQQTFQNSSQMPTKKVSHIFCARDDGRKYLINCVEESARMGLVNCFDNKMRIKNRSLIRVVAEDEARAIMARTN